MSKKAPGGRPPKFGEPSRPITITLPDSTLEGLKIIHPDRAQAIVDLTNGALSQKGGSRPPVEIARVADNVGMIIVGPSQALRRIPFLKLVEITAGRYLLALMEGSNFNTLELAIRDQLDELAPSDKWELKLLTQLLENVKKLRQTDRVSMAEILFVRMDGAE
jgi:hypothetical protein